MIVKEIQVKSLICKSGIPGAEFVINPYTGCPHKCVYCYAEFMKRFTDHKEKWGEFLDVKKCDKPLKASRFNGRSIMLSSVTDCYNQFEAQYEKTRDILRLFIGSEAKISILTKSALITRDLDILRGIKNIEVGFSFSSVDDNFRKIMEPRAASPEEKLNAMKLLSGSAVAVWVFISPFFPELTDYKAIIEKCRPYTNRFGFESLKLRSLYKTRVLKLIKERYPAVFPAYNIIYHNKISAAEYWNAKKKEFTEYCTREGIAYDLFLEADHKVKSGGLPSPE
jgi:DNA repair photolyase